MFWKKLKLLFSREGIYTWSDVRVLLNRIKSFNAGAVDKPLSRHIEKEFDKWKDEF